ncbi:beta/alpha barrel domain-containing protein [Flavilitoribacter nigricans]|uniref:Uncharacterized protein n=1 Tax=Flavilitoribacter nigricans (strain ATCC 23147 / DSM 23189 / NBRC 102662 / NCIMB 1420 / SS-2) TaxID=1122177 RepID=A0A2D0NAT6_FLAN2|nr:hypothetical protein [Flavilitoribacter nigricans]PHN05498.1 hypothetical protein CRP01_16005 [Flavilitoribacter nigricans DSM 23189 = NBRC 102662]
MNWQESIKAPDRTGTLVLENAMKEIQWYPDFIDLFIEGRPAITTQGTIRTLKLFGISNILNVSFTISGNLKEDLTPIHAH